MILLWETKDPLVAVCLCIGKSSLSIHLKMLEHTMTMYLFRCPLFSVIFDKLQIEGNNGDDVIFGQGGRDDIYGGPGNDGIVGGYDVEFNIDDGDTIYGDDGSDYILGDNDDTIYGGDGNDVIIGQNGVDYWWRWR